MDNNTNTTTDIFEEVTTNLEFGQAAANIQSDFVKFSITGANDCKFYPLTGGNVYQNPNTVPVSKAFTADNHILPHVKGCLHQKRSIAGSDIIINSLDVDLYALGATCDIMDNTKIVKRISRVHGTAYSVTKPWNWEIQKQGLNIIGWTTVSFNDLVDKPKANTADVPGAFLTDRFMVISENDLASGGKNAMSFTVNLDSIKVGVSILNILDPDKPNVVDPL